MIEVNDEILKQIIDLQHYLATGKSVVNILSDTNDSVYKKLINSVISIVDVIFTNVKNIDYDLPFGTRDYKYIEKIVNPNNGKDDEDEKVDKRKNYQLTEKLTAKLCKDDLYYKLVSCYLFSQNNKTNLGGLFSAKLKSKYVSEKEIRFCFSRLTDKDIVYLGDGEKNEIKIEDFIRDFFGLFKNQNEEDSKLENEFKTIIGNVKMSHEECQEELNKFFSNVQKEIDKNYDLTDGAVMFCDFLGWKGLWKNEGDKKAPTLANELIEKISIECKIITEEFIPISKHIPITKIISISDTIAILTPKVTNLSKFQLLEMYAKMGKYILQESIKVYPLRGAITLGEFNFNKNIMIGPAIDEAASWHEMSDWIGIILAPTAQFEYMENGLIENVTKYDIPLKEGRTKLSYCIDWHDKDNDLKKLISKTKALTPDVASKYIKTYNFLNKEVNING